MQEHTFYREDILKNGYMRITIPLKDDYEGHVVSTLIRRSAEIPTDKAVLYIHGFNDYFFQKEMGIRFNDHQYNFYALDLRKYGRSFLSHQKFNTVRNLEEYFEEISEAISIIGNEGNKEIILMGHSTGGLIVTLFAKRNQDKNLFNGLILNSPFFDFNLIFPEKLILALASFAGKFLPNIKIPGGFSEEYGKSLHHSFYGDWDYNQEWKPNKPPKVNLGWIRAIYTAQKTLKNAFQIKQPVLIMHSSASTKKTDDPLLMKSHDAILNVRDIMKTAQNIKGKVEIASIKNGMHDLVLSSKEVRENVYETMFKWLISNSL